MKGYDEIVTALLEAGADLNAACDIIGFTPLMFAAEHNHVAALRLLIQAGADLNKCSKHGRDTALIRAVFSGHEQATAVLLLAGARIDIVNDDGKSALDYARERSDAALIQLLEQPDGQPEAFKKRITLLKRRMSPAKRFTFLPRTSERPRKRTVSHFGGDPWLPPEDPWPTCPNCGTSQTLLLQLDLSTLPEQWRTPEDTGLLQLFYCLACRPHAPFAPQQTVRIWPVDGETLHLSERPSPGEHFPARYITTWRREPDYPVREAHDPGNACYLPKLDAPATLIRRLNHATDKLGGWPHWIQDADYPRVPQEEHPLDRLVMQLTSGGNLPWTWGDNGIGYLVRSATRPGLMTFFWQSP
jgi:hypothetical protein